MKKTVVFLLATMLVSVVATAQGVQTYTMETSSEPWVSISSTGTQLPYVAGDGGYQNIAMPFEFNFGEAILAQGDIINVRSDGYMLLCNSTGAHHSYGYCNSSTRVIVPFLLVDGQMPQGNSGCWWQVDTTDDGQQVLVVEFQHVQHYNVSTDDFNYQVRLYENGNVSVHYGHMENHANDSSFNFMMVSDAIGGYNDAIALMGSWDSPTAFHPYSMGSSSSSVPHHITGMPDSGLVVTYYRPEPPCPKPTHVRAEELEPTSCQLMWTGNGVTGCTYEIYLDTTYFNVTYPGSRPLLSTNDTVLYLDSLLPNHQYAGYIRSNCGADVSNWVQFSIYTPCPAISHAELPFTENFEFYVNYLDQTTIFNPGCWRASSTGQHYVTQQSGYGGHRCLYLANGGDAQPIIVALPAIDSLSDLEISFSVQLQSGTLEVGVLDEADNTASFVPVQTINVASSAWTTRSVRLSSYDGTGKAIAFRVTTAVSRVYIDDIDVHFAVGCPAVEMMTVSDVASTTATVSWTDPNQVGSYRVLLHPLQPAGSPTTINASASPVLLTGLTPDEDYVVEIYSLCGSQQSIAVADTFRTLCAPKTAPFSESFEDSTLSLCWTTRSMRFYSSNPVPNWLPEVSQTEATAGTQSLRLSSKRTNLVGREASWLVLPTTTDAPDRLMVDFDYKVPSGYEYVELVVGITTSETDTTGFVRLATIRPADGDWHRYSVNFALSGITDGRIAMLQDNHSDHSYAGGLPNEYGYLDSVVVTPFSGCMRPVALSVSMVSDVEATVSWIDVNGAGTYEVTCGTQTVTVSGDTNWTFTGLSPQTTYSVSVRTMCPDGLTEAVVTSFTTTCAGITDFPWSEGFDSWPEDSFDSCWTRLQGADVYSSVQIFDFMNLHSMRMNAEVWQGDTNRSFLVLPQVSMPYTGLAISMNVMGFNSDATNTRLELGVMTNGADRNTFSAFDTIPFTDGGLDNWDYYERALAGIGNGRLALRFTSLNSSRSVYIDDISLFYATSCSRPDSLVLDSAGLSSLGVRIVDADSSGHYRLWWSDGSSVDSADITGYTYTVTGLRHSTLYDLSVASVCPSDGTLSTLLSVPMATACGVLTRNDLPWSQNFDDGLGICQSFLDYCYPGNSGDRTNPTIGRGNSGALVPNVGWNSQPFFYVMPRVDSIGGLALDFWARGEAKVEIGVMVDPADTLTFTALQTIQLTSLTQWREYYVSLEPYGSTGLHLTMRFGNPDSSFHASAVLDDVVLMNDLSCQAPDSVSVAALTDSSALLLVHDPRGVGHYRLYALGDTTDFYGDSIWVTGLQQVTEYTLGVASLCPEGLATFPVEVTFTTDCGINELPWEEDFETLRTNRLAPCWNYEAAASSRPWVFSSPATVRSGQQGLIGSIAAGDSLMTVVTPQMHIADTDLYVNFLARVYHAVRNDSSMLSTRIPMRLRVSYWGDSVAQPLVVYDDSLQSYESGYSAEAQWHLVEIATTRIPAGVGNFYFSFFRDANAVSASFGLDSVSIFAVHHEPPCQPVADVLVDNITLTRAYVHWTPQGPATEWQLQLHSIQGDTVIVADNPQVNLTGLGQGTDYTLRVRPLCWDGQLLWSDEVTFTTLDCPAVEQATVLATAAHSVDIVWQAPTDGPWRVEYGPRDFAQGLGSQLVIPSQPAGRVSAHIDGLDADSEYDLYVMTLCDENVNSVWSEVVRFTTEVDGIDAPQSSADSRFLITPNPAHGSVTLSGLVPGAAVAIRDASGRTVMTFKVQDSKSRLALDDLMPGVYFVTASTPASTATRKLIVQ